jgi:hypothetical protein
VAVRCGAVRCGRWKEENAYIRKLVWSSKLYLVLRTFLYVIVALGLIYNPVIIGGKKDELWWVLWHLLILVLIVALNTLLDRVTANGQYQGCKRPLKILLGLSLVMLVIVAIALRPAYLVYVLALYFLGATLATILLVLGVQAVRQLYRVHDLILGHVLFVPIIIFAALQVRNRAAGRRGWCPLL